MASPELRTSLNLSGASSCPQEAHSDQKKSKSKEIDPTLLKKFKSELRNSFYDDIGHEQIATNLFQIAPNGLEVEDIIDLVFEECHERPILRLLDAITLTHPSISLSPYNKIRRTIVEDWKHLLTNHSLILLLTEQVPDITEEQITACYDLAYHIKHPYIYRLSRTPVPTSDYTLNFLWVNLNPQDRIQDIAHNIFNDGSNLSENAECIKDPRALRPLEKEEQLLEKDDLENWEKIKRSFTYRISLWADANPNAQINLWYDSALVTKKAQQKTFEMMKEISRSRGVNLRLRDIRQLPNIKGEIENSLHPGTQVYYRVDILKALIADFMISSPEESAKYCVVSDIDVEPMPPEQLFDQRTLDYLSSNGYVFMRGGVFNDFENGFFIFNRERKDLRTIHDETIIKQTASHITSLRPYPIGSIRLKAMLDAQFVCSQYANFLEDMQEPLKRRRGRLESRIVELLEPRKDVNCPESQFMCGGNFSKSDYQAERFRFIGTSNIPYTLDGRTCFHCERQLEELKKWKAEPLDLPQ